MTLTGTLLSILIGACWLAAAAHFFAGVRRSFNPIHLSFATFAFATGAQSLAFIWLHHATDVHQYIEAARWGSTAGAISGAALPWFARFYTRSDDFFVPLALSLVYLACAALNMYLPYGYYFEQPPTLTWFQLPWGEVATSHVFSGFSERLLFTLVLNVATIAFVFYACFRQYRRGQRQPALTLALGMSLVLVMLAINVAISAAGFRSMYLSSFGFLVLVLAMMYRLSSDASFRTVVAQASEGIFIADTRGRCIDVNVAGCELLGWSRDELLDKHIHDIVASEDVPKLAEQQEALASGAVVRLRCNFLRKDGSTFRGELSSRLLPDGRFLGMLIDVTAQETLLRNLEERVAARTAEYAELNRQLESFAYSVSHDLRAPVRSVGAFSAVLLQEHGSELSAEARRHLERISLAAGHMNELIEGLLQLAQVSHQALRNESVDIAAMINNIVRAIRERAPDRQVEVICRELPLVSGDSRLLSIALQNLLENAWKYTSGRTHARIEIECVVESGRATFCVKDNGAGFDMQYAEHLFQPFRRLHTAKEFPGTGIGLATVARVVERHGGSVWAYAEPDKGASFYFTLKTLDERAAPQASARNDSLELQSQLAHG
jgi:PAS domain S-box-containing protein